MTPAETRSAVAHLLRRAGFGAHADDIDALAELGYEGAVDEVCDLVAVDHAAEAVALPEFDTAGYLADRRGDVAARQRVAEQTRRDRRELVLWWVRRMVAAERPLREKLTFLWHDHFATSLKKVKIPELLVRQHRTLYELGRGQFDELVAAVARDPAMLIWLDGRGSTVRAPNENFARELFELFTLGHGDHHGRQPYTEADVADAARALTGWVIDWGTGEGRLVARRHDHADKTVLGTTGNLGLDEVVAAATGHPACAPYVVSELWSRLARPAGPDDPVVRELAEPFARDLDIGALVRRIFLHPEFLAPATRTGLVKTPVELVVGIARAVRLDVDDRALLLLRHLGQVPFLPPDVNGWPANEAWLSTASALTHLQLATFVAKVADLEPIASAGASDRPAAAARLLGVDRWGDTTAAALRDAATDPRAVLTVALVAPEHLMA